MEVFKILNGYDGHAVHFVYDRKSHLRAIIALDTIRDGRAVGGIRNMEYRTEDAAINDACQLARAMSFKAALAGLPCGGAKCVIFKHPSLKRAAAYRALGVAVRGLDGLYHAGLDVGTTMTDLQHLAGETRHVSHRLEFGKLTARGVVASIRATLKVTEKYDSLKEVQVAIQGLGEVGMEIARLLYKEGARLVVADSVKRKCTEARRRYEAEVVAPDKILLEPCDVLSPCAMGGIITRELVPRLACRAIVGSANTMLASPTISTVLMRAGITFVPDYISSAGALIIGVTEIAYGKAKAKPALVDRIYDTTVKVLRTGLRRGVSNISAAETIAAKTLKR